MDERLPTMVNNMIKSLSLRQLHFICSLALAAACLSVLAPALLVAVSQSAAGSGGNGWRDAWPARFLTNLAGYATVLLPLQLVVCLSRRWGYGRREPQVDGGPWLLPTCIRVLALGGSSSSNRASGVPKDEATPKILSPREAPQHQGTMSLGRCLHLAGCFLGLQAAYLSWGVLQERMMTFDYGGERFSDSQFLVFANRALGGILALPLMLTAGGFGGGTAPAFEYSYSSLSNILSSWCQYEALVHVSFPTQVLAKASKIIPVMLMGRLVSRKTYRTDEYCTSAMISAGTALFLLSSATGGESHSAGWSISGALSGACLLAGYLAFDAFTSSWQSLLFTDYRVSAVQMLAGSSLLSCLVTLAAQLQQGSLSAAGGFVNRHPLFGAHLCLLSLCSTLGQLVIFHTIDKFGPVTFIIIMTVRQAFAILISCAIYQHRLSGNAWFGVGTVFAALFLRIYFANRAQHRAKQRTGKSKE